MVKQLLSYLVVGSICLAASCGGPRVVLNERLFELPSMKPAGRGCSWFDLGGEGAGSGGSFNPELRMYVEQRLDGDRVVITVSEDGQKLEQRKYGEGFFKNHQLDEFVATNSTSAQLLLRFWGSTEYEPSSCAPFENDGPDGH